MKKIEIVSIGLVIILMMSVGFNIYQASTSKYQINNLNDEIESLEGWKDWYSNRHSFADDYAWFGTDDSLYWYNISRICVTNESYNLSIKYDHNDYFKNYYNKSYVFFYDVPWWIDMFEPYLEAGK